ncbi:MAG TPA: class I SAM-dependent DNA methyltransferase [Bacteroidales bacterium]|nr:class I SAM-dependent DNA methyltransferase [Bacteroidales bacterium]
MKHRQKSDYIMQHSTFCNFNHSDSWVILSAIEQRIKAKIERIGTPLKDWDIQINYGIKTGFNDAFIITGEKRKELIEKDPKSEEIIRPILRGRDIKRYSYDFADLWLINTHNGIKEKGIPPIDISNYPAIKEHLDNYFPQLEKRQDKGNTPYNLRNCAYMEDFSKPKIVFQEMVQESAFSYDEDVNFFCLDTGRIIVGKDLKYLLTFLNSKLFFYAVKKYYGGGGLGESGVRMKHTFFEKFHCIKNTGETNLIDIANRIIKSNDNEERAKLLNEVDNIIFKLYDLSDKEIEFIETQ